MKVILFLVAVYSLIINQCYQKKNPDASFPQKEMNVLANTGDTTRKTATGAVQYSIPEDNNLYLPQFSVLGTAMETY